MDELAKFLSSAMDTVMTNGRELSPHVVKAMNSRVTGEACIVVAMLITTIALAGLATDFTRHVQREMKARNSNYEVCPSGVAAVCTGILSAISLLVTTICACDVIPRWLAAQSDPIGYAVLQFLGK